MNLSKDDEKFLELYSDSIYDKPSVTIDNVILRFRDIENNNYRKHPDKKLQICLIKRAYSPYKDCYAVPGTFIDLKDSLSNTLKKCLENKIGLKDFYFEQLYTFGDEQRDPRTRVISIAYLILTNKQEQLKNCEWFDIDFQASKNEFVLTNNGYKKSQKIKITLTNKNTTLTNEILVKFEKKNFEEIKTIKIIKSELAFDHIKILYFAFERLKNKLEYTDVIFNLMPKYFTLTELKLCFEQILHENLLDAKFRRKIADKVKPVDLKINEKGHRPSRFFEHNVSWNLNNIE